MNWYKRQKESGWKDLGLGLGVGLGIGMPLALNQINPDVKNSIPNNEKPTITKVDDGNTYTIKNNNDSYLEGARLSIRKHEGVRKTVYNDSLGVPTIGVGFNLTRPDSKKIIESLGLNYELILSGKQSLNDQQIEKLFNINLSEAEQVARNLIKSFDEQPDTVKIVLVDMAFNLGPNKFALFKEFIKAINNKNYNKAAIEMQNSKWYGQVGNRSKNLTNLIKNNARIPA